MNQHIKSRLLALLEDSHQFSYDKLPKGTYGHPSQVPVEWDIWINRTQNVIADNFLPNSTPMNLVQDGMKKAKALIGNSENTFNYAKERLQHALSKALEILDNDIYGEIKSPNPIPKTQDTMTETNQIDIFISHSSKDINFIQLLVDLILGSIKGTDPEKVRCTSLPGHKLPTGSHASTKLRSEIQSCKVLIGVITENSLDSLYVMFELGAAWGIQKNLFPICGPKCTFGSFRAPLNEYHGIKWNEETDWSQFVEDLANVLGRETQSLAKVNSLIKRVTSFTPTETAEPQAEAPSA